MKIYFQAKSKAAINERLAKGDDLVGLLYSATGGSWPVKFSSLRTGAVIARWEKKDPSGYPIPVAWHEWNADKQRCE